MDEVGRAESSRVPKQPARAAGLSARQHRALRRALVSKPELLPVFGEVSFSGSTPEPGEMDGADASNFAHTEDLPFPVLYRGAVVPELGGAHVEGNTQLLIQLYHSTSCIIP